MIGLRLTPRLSPFGVAARFELRGVLAGLRDFPIRSIGPSRSGESIVVLRVHAAVGDDDLLPVQVPMTGSPRWRSGHATLLAL